MADKRNIYFISDTHLGATYIADRRAHERAVAEWIESIIPDAAELYMLGDILDYWYEYRTVAPRGYLRFFGALARLVDSGTRVVWFTGNHDIWLFDYLRDELGVEIVDGSLTADLFGLRLFLAHGDGVGKLKPGFRLMRTLFRNRFCQLLFAAVHPRWTIPFAHRWSTSSRDYSPEVPVCESPQTEPLVVWAREEALRRPDIDCFIFGHRHLLLAEKAGENAEVVILGDWIHHYSWARLDPDGHLTLWRRGQGPEPEKVADIAFRH